MKLSDQISKSIYEYPSLFKDVDMQKSRIKVLDQLFLVIGNGYEWTDGYLAEMVCKKNGSGFKKFLPYGKEKFSVKLDEKYFKNPIYRTFDHHPEILKLIMENPKFKDLSMIEDCSLFLATPYPISEYSKLNTVPDNVRPDWLDGAIETAEWALSFYTGPDSQLRTLNYQKSMTYKPEVLTSLAKIQTDILCKALKRLKTLGEKI